MMIPPSPSPTFFPPISSLQYSVFSVFSVMYSCYATVSDKAIKIAELLLIAFPSILSRTCSSLCPPSSMKNKHKGSIIRHQFIFTFILVLYSDFKRSHSVDFKFQLSVFFIVSSLIAWLFNYCSNLLIHYLKKLFYSDLTIFAQKLLAKLSDKIFPKIYI